MVQIIAVLGGKGGCGKSSCSIGLSFALAEQKKRVLLIDLDEGMRCLDMLLGVSEKLIFDIIRVEPKGFDEIQSHTGLNTEELLILLTEMELNGLIEQTNGDRYKTSV